MVLTALVRASGIVGAVVTVAALVSGSLFSARETGRRIRPAWLLDLHNGLGGLSLVVVGVHVLASVLDADLDIGVAEVLVPGVAGTDRLALSWGVLATYLVAGAALTTWPRRLRARRLWRIVHLGSAIGVALALVHGYQMGTDAGQLAFRVLLVAITAVATYSLGVRAFDVVHRARAAGSQTAPR